MARESEQRISASAGQTFKAGCFGALGALTATWLVGIAVVILVCGGGITFISMALNSAREAADNRIEADGDAPDDTEHTFALNEIAAAESVSIAVTDAAIGIVPLANFIGGDAESQNPALAITFRVENTDERKIVRRVDNPFLGSRPRLEDDAGNSIRGVDYPGTPKGEMNDDLNPGDSTTHVEVFMIPPPATEFLLLTVDFAMFGSEGEAVFRIDVDEIEGWPVTPD